MTPLSKVYDAFLSKQLDDEWTGWEVEQMEKDWRTFLDAAIPLFKFPKVDLDIDEETQSFVGDLKNSEIQILATYMKCEWLNRTILTWEHIKPMYEEKDFSEANLIDKLNDLLEFERKNAKQLESIYYRSINGKPFDYTKLASENNTTSVRNKRRIR